MELMLNNNCCYPIAGEEGGKLHNARYKSSHCLTFIKQYKESTNNVVPGPTLWAPWNMALPKPKPELHTSHSRNSNQQHTVSLTLHCITPAVGITHVVYCWSQPIAVVWKCCVSPASSKQAAPGMSSSVAGLVMRKFWKSYREARVEPMGGGKTHGWKMILQMKRRLMVLL